MADTLDILSLPEGKTAINLAASNTDHDTELAQHITAVSRYIDSQCGPVVNRTVTAEVHTIGSGSVVILKHAPVSSVSLVREASGGTITSLSAVAFGGNTDGYSLDPDLPGFLFRNRGGSRDVWSSDQVEVTYVAGRYANTAAVDPRFKTCAASILNRLWKRESGAWAHSPDFFEQLDPNTTSTVGFFRVAKPIVDELLWDELVLPGVG